VNQAAADSLARVLAEAVVLVGASAPTGVPPPPADASHGLTLGMCSGAGVVGECRTSAGRDADARRHRPGCAVACCC
jgi:hypothetical protein